jgi:hypothetical protein
MKPSFELDHPIFKLAIQTYQQQMEKALAVPQRVESAVLPIYLLLKSKTKPEQAASGVVLRIKDEFFVFSASHVFDPIKNYRLLIGAGDGTLLATLGGERFSSSKGASGTHADDPIDASVFHIQEGITDGIKKVALTLEDLDFSQPDTSKFIYMAAGFRTKKSYVKGKFSNCERECFPSLEYGNDEYSLLDINKNYHIALAYDNQVIMNGKWQTSPTPKGISGGAIIKVEGVTMSPPFVAHPESRQLLSAITIEQKRGKAGKPGVLIGTRISVHLGLIDKFLPNFLDSSDIQG